jgi:CelD/BcsL family acetyltransferase involved in cellulose biosynthesis
MDDAAFPSAAVCDADHTLVGHHDTTIAAAAAAADVSDAGNGGQVLMDDATFARIKEELHPLGAVDANGLNYDKLAARTSLVQLLCLGTLCSSR